MSAKTRVGYSLVYFEWKKENFKNVDRILNCYVSNLINLFPLSFRPYVSSHPFRAVATLIFKLKFINCQAATVLNQQRTASNQIFKSTKTSHFKLLVFPFQQSASTSAETWIRPAMCIHSRREKKSVLCLVVHEKKFPCRERWYTDHKCTNEEYSRHSFRVRFLLWDSTGAVEVCRRRVPNSRHKSRTIFSDEFMAKKRYCDGSNAVRERVFAEFPGKCT